MLDEGVQSGFSYVLVESFVVAGLITPLLYALNLELVFL